MVTLQREIMMQSNIKDTVNRTEKIMSLRKTIYRLEAMNIHKKIPQSDSEMVEKIIREIKRIAEKEEEK